MNGFITTNLQENEIVKASDVQLGGDNGIENLEKFYKVLLKADKNTVIGGKIRPVTDGSGLKARMDPIMGIHAETEKVFMDHEGKFYLDGDKDLSDIISFADAETDIRRDIVEVKADTITALEQSRQFYNPDTETTSYSFTDIQKRQILRLKVKKGITGSDVAPETDEGYVKLCEVVIPAYALSLEDSNILNITADESNGENSAWTIEKDSTVNPGTIKDIKDIFRTIHNADGTLKNNVVSAEKILLSGEGALRGSIIEIGGGNVVINGVTYGPSTSISDIIAALNNKVIPVSQGGTGATTQVEAQHKLFDNAMADVTNMTPGDDWSFVGHYSDKGPNPLFYTASFRKIKDWIKGWLASDSLTLGHSGNIYNGTFQGNVTGTFTGSPVGIAYGGTGATTQIHAQHNIFDGTIQDVRNQSLTDSYPLLGWYSSTYDGSLLYATTIGDIKNHFANTFLKKDGASYSDSLMIIPNAYNGYNEGIRIGKAQNGWSNIQFGCANTAISGTVDGQWLVGTPGTGEFIIEHNNSVGNGLVLSKDASYVRWWGVDLAPRWVTKKGKFTKDWGDDFGASGYLVGDGTQREASIGFWNDCGKWVIGAGTADEANVFSIWNDTRGGNIFAVGNDGYCRSAGYYTTYPPYSAGISSVFVDSGDGFIGKRSVSEFMSTMNIMKRSGIETTNHFQININNDEGGWCEGIRIAKTTGKQYAGIFLNCDPNADRGTVENQWAIVTMGDDINNDWGTRLASIGDIGIWHKNDNTGAALYLHKDGSSPNWGSRTVAMLDDTVAGANNANHATTCDQLGSTWNNAPGTLIVGTFIPPFNGVQYNIAGSFVTSTYYEDQYGKHYRIHIDNDVGLLVASNSGGVAYWRPLVYTEISPDTYTVLATTINLHIGLN